MTVSPKLLYLGGQLGAAATPIYTAPSNERDLIGAATFTNTDTVDHMLTIYIVRSGDAPGVTNVLIDAMILRPGEAYVSPELEGQILENSDSIQGFADVANMITCAGISGFTL